MKGRHAAATIATVAAVALGLLFCLSCGGEARKSAAQGGAGNAGSASAPDSQARGGSSALGGACGSAPKEHRAVAQACPNQRGSTGPLDMTACANRAGITCTKDADCTAGLNGRCLAHNEPCDTACSYDECSQDSDCAAGPCLCRNDSAATLSNQCSAGSSCKTDADCGKCGYCSPSAVPEGFECSVGLPAYTCHTAHDECTDPSDCDGGYCADDATRSRWACGSCVPVPHP